MTTSGKSTLTQFLIEERARYPRATGELNALVTSLSLVCKAISRRVAIGRLADHSTEQQMPLLQFSNEMFLNTTEWGGVIGGMASEVMEQVHTLPAHPRGNYLLVFDPLDGVANADVNVSLGSIFSIFRAPIRQQDALPVDFLQPGAQQVCAGYAIYGPATMLVITMGRGTHAFTLDPWLGEWVMSHRDLRIPERTREFAIDSSNSRFWGPAVRRYVDECLAGPSGPRGDDFNVRWVDSLVAETHRILVRGGVFLSPRSAADASTTPPIRLLFEANAIAWLVEQAGGRASTGWTRLLDVAPTSLHQRVGLVFGSREEVVRLEGYHVDAPPDEYRAPLFGTRGLFAPAD